MLLAIQIYSWKYNLQILAKLEIFTELITLNLAPLLREYQKHCLKLTFSELFDILPQHGLRKDREPFQPLPPL